MDVESELTGKQSNQSKHHPSAARVISGGYFKEERTAKLERHLIKKFSLICL